MAPKTERVKTSLQIEEKIHLQEAGWVVQRIGWAVMLIFLVLAGLGLFGDGILSRAQLTNEGIRVHYEKYFRRQADTEIRIQGPAVAGAVQLTLSPAFTRNYRIEQIIPAPSDRNIDNATVIYSFPAQGVADISLVVQPIETGRRSSPLSVNGTVFDLHTFIYP